MRVFSGLNRVATQHVLVVDIVGLVLAAIVIHGIYLLYIDPLAAAETLRAAELGDVPERLVVIVLKDLEQELCLILSLWCLWLWAFRYRLFQNETYLLDVDFLELQRIESYDAATLARLRNNIQAAMASFSGSQLLTCVDVAITNLQRGEDFNSAREASNEACDLHLEVLNSKLSVTKYILWAIPSVGFLGTVRGIGEALGQAGEAMAGNITGVAASLGVAFNSTFVAIFMSLILMFVSYVLQGREERLVAAFKHFISATLLTRLSQVAQVPPIETHSGQ